MNQSPKKLPKNKVKYHRLMIRQVCTCGIIDLCLKLTVGLYFTRTLLDYNMFVFAIFQIQPVTYLIPFTVAFFYQIISALSHNTGGWKTYAY